MDNVFGHKLASVSGQHYGNQIRGLLSEFINIEKMTFPEILIETRERNGHFLKPPPLCRERLYRLLSDGCLMAPIV